MQGGGYAGEKPSMTDKVKNVLGMGGNHHTTGTHDSTTGYGTTGTFLKTLLVVKMFNEWKCGGVWLLLYCTPFLSYWKGVTPIRLAI